MLNSIGLANPWNRPLSRADAATAGGTPKCRSGSRWAASRSRVRRPLRSPRRPARRRSDRAQRLLPERRRCPGERGGDRRRVAGATRKPLYTKLSPATADIAEVARAAQKAGTDGLSLVNTILGLALRRADPKAPPLPRRGRPLWAALKRSRWQPSMRATRRRASRIVGMGGITRGRDALELLAAGAASVALGTILFADPGAPARIRSRACKRNCEPRRWRDRQRNRPRARRTGRDFQDCWALRSDVCPVNTLQIETFLPG